MEGYWAGWTEITLRRWSNVPKARVEISRQGSYTPTEGQGEGDGQVNVKAIAKLKAKATLVFFDIFNVWYE